MAYMDGRVVAAISEIGSVMAGGSTSTTLSEVSGQLEGIGDILTEIDINTNSLETQLNAIIVLETDQLAALDVLIDNSVATTISEISEQLVGLKVVLDGIDENTDSLTTQLNDILVADSQILNFVTLGAQSSADIVTNTLRQRQDAGGRLLVAAGTTTLTTTTITASFATDTHSMRIRFVSFSPSVPGSHGGGGWQIDNMAGGQLGFKSEWAARADRQYVYNLGPWYHEITTVGFRIRQFTGSLHVNYHVGYTIQEKETFLP